MVKYDYKLNFNKNKLKEYLYSNTIVRDRKEKKLLALFYIENYLIVIIQNKYFIKETYFLLIFIYIYLLIKFIILYRKLFNCILADFEK